MLYVPGQFGHVPDEAGNLRRDECRLSFGVAEPGRIAEGVRRLRAAYRAVAGV